MLEIKRSTLFKKNFKRIVQQPFYDEEEFKKVINTLVEEKPLEEREKDNYQKHLASKQGVFRNNNLANIYIVC